MKLVDLEAFRNKVRLCYSNYEDALRRLEIDWARKEGLAPEALRGQARQRILEAHIRAYVLDPILQALGWRLDSAANMVVEDGVEPRSPHDNRRFLDYHGREQEDEAKASSLLIVEAKRPMVQLPAVDPNTGLGTVSQVVAQALAQIHEGKEVSAVSKSWADFLKTLVDYAERAKRETKHAPKVVAITSGDWFIVFENTEAALLSKAPLATAITVYADSHAVLQGAEGFWKSLSYEVLSEHVPPQTPASLQHFVASTTEKVEVVLTVDISYASHGDHQDQQPSIAGRVRALVRVAGGGWITFLNNYPANYVEIHHDGDQFSAVLREFARRSEGLLGELRQHANVTLLSVVEAEAVLKKQRADMPHLCTGKDGRNYRLVTGDVPFFVVEDAAWDSCPYHDFGPCKAEGKPNPHGAIYGRSIDPRVFFPSGSPMHCAHSAVHESRRKVDCVIAGFEQLLCCRRCAFFSRCYPGNNANLLPCRKREGAP